MREGLGEGGGGILVKPLAPKALFLFQDLYASYHGSPIQHSDSRREMLAFFGLRVCISMRVVLYL